MALWERHSASLAHFAKGRTAGNLEDLDERIATVKRELARVKSPAYLQELEGTIGADPFHGMIASPV